MPKIKKNNDLSMNMALADIKSAEAILKDSSGQWGQTPLQKL